MHLAGKLAATKMYLGIVGLLVSVGLIILAIVLYSRKLYVGYSFLLFLIGGFVSVFTWLIALSAFPSAELKKQRFYFSLGLSAIVFVFTICGMATVFWFAQEWSNSLATGSNNFGLLGYLQTGTTTLGTSWSESGTFDDFYTRYQPDGYARSYVQKLQDGGKAVLGCGIVALIASIFSVVCMIISLIKPHPARSSFMVAAVLSMLGASILFLVGVSLYAVKLWISWSFMLYLGCALLFLASVLALIKGALEDDSKTTTTATRKSTAPAPPPTTSSGGAYDNSGFSIVGVETNTSGSGSGEVTHFRYNS